LILLCMEKKLSQFAVQGAHAIGGFAPDVQTRGASLREAASDFEHLPAAGRRIVN